MVFKNVTIFVNDNENHKAVKSHSFETKDINCDKQTNTVITICIVNLLCQIGVYFCLFKLEQNSLLIGGIGLTITCFFLILFYIGYFKKVKNYKYTNISYIICQILLVILIILRISQYICYSTIHRIYELEVRDPLNNVNKHFFFKKMERYGDILLRCCGAIMFLVFWCLGINKSYKLYNETCRIVKRQSNLKKLNKMKTEPIQIGTQKANWNQPCIF